MVQNQKDNFIKNMNLEEIKETEELKEFEEVKQISIKFDSRFE